MKITSHNYYYNNNYYNNFPVINNLSDGKG